MSELPIFQDMGKESMRAWVLANPEHVNEKDSYMNTLLYNAVHRHPDPEYISWLLERGYDVDGDDPEMQPIFGVRSVDVLSVLLENGTSPLKTDFLGRTALMVHAMTARADCVERLLQSPRVRETIDMLSSGPISCQYMGGTALHLACWRNKLGVSKTRTIELLLLSGANPTLAVPSKTVFLGPPVLRTPLQILRDEYPNDHESIALLERAMAEPTRFFWLSKARHQIDALHSLTTIAQNARGTTEEKQAVCVAKAPMYLKERVAAGHPLPVVELKKKEVPFSFFSFFTGVGEDREEKKLMAVLCYVVQAQEEEEEKEQDGGSKNRNGGMLPEVFVELMEMMAPKWDPIRGGGEA